MALTLDNSIHNITLFNVDKEQFAKEIADNFDALELAAKWLNHNSDMRSLFMEHIVNSGAIESLIEDLIFVGGPIANRFRIENSEMIRDNFETHHQGDFSDDE